MFNGTLTQSYPVKTVPSKNNNLNLYNFISINYSNVQVTIAKALW